MLHNNPTFRHKDIGLRHNKTSLFHNKVSLRHKAASPFTLVGEDDVGALWDARTINAAVDEPVTSWPDALGRVTLTVPEGEDAPVLRSSGSNRWVEYTGTEVLSGEFSISTAAVTIVVAAQNDSTATVDADQNLRIVILKVPAADSAERDLNINTNVVADSGNLGMRHPENQSVQYAGAQLEAPGVLSYQRNGTAIQDAWLNGVLGTRNTETTTTFATTHIGIGCSIGTSPTTFNLSFQGKIFGVFVIDRLLDAAERIAVEAYMRGTFN